MTTQLRFEGGTPFGIWLRQKQQIDSRKIGLSIQNLDYIIHRYSFKSCQAIMLIEEKRFKGRSSFAQQDTHNILHQGLQYANLKPVKTARGQTMPLRYLGYHTLVFEKTSPDDGRMWWDGQEITTDYLFKLLRFEVDPNLRINQKAAS